jgi:hypothetical protein
VRLCQIQLIATIALSRLAVSMGNKQIQMTWIVGSFFFLLIALQTNWAVSGLRLAALAGLALVTAFESAYFHYTFSPLSLTYLFGIYAPLCLTLPELTREDIGEIWKTYINLSVVVAVCGLVQVTGEIVGGGYFLDLVGFLPDSLQLSGYSTVYQGNIGGFNFVKPNGMLALEPSFFSQFVALGLVGELHYFRRIKIFVLLVAGLFASFSGTGNGIIDCAVCVALHQALGKMVGLDVGGRCALDSSHGRQSG